MEHVLAIEPVTEEQKKLVGKLGARITAYDQAEEIDLANISILYGWDSRLAPQVLKAPGSRLKWIQTISAGIDYLPIETLKERQIKVTNSSGLHARPISQSILGYILFFIRGLWQSQQAYPSRKWKRVIENLLTIDELTVLVFGTGRIAIELARDLKNLGAEVYGVNTTGHPAENFDQTFPADNYSEALSRSNVIVNIMPGTAETNHFFDKSFFGKLDQQLIFINVGRGSTVDQSALLDALRSRKLLFAASDVADPEPLPASSELWDEPHLLLTPHISGLINRFGEQLFSSYFEVNLKQFVRDQTLAKNIVDLDKGY